MTDLPQKIMGHRRANSETISLPTELEFERAIFHCSRFEDDDLISMFNDIDKEKDNSSSGKAEVVFPSQGLENVNNEKVGGSNHRQTRSMDESSFFIKKEWMGGLASEGVFAPTTNKTAMLAPDLVELSVVDPKRAKRILANRQSAARSKIRKMRYISGLEQKFQSLKTETTTLSAQVAVFQKKVTDQAAENTELKLRVHAMEKHLSLLDEVNDSLQGEANFLRLRVATHIISDGGRIPTGDKQRLFPPNEGMPTILDSPQFQLLQIQSLRLEQLQLQQKQHLELQQQLKKQQAKDKEVVGSQASSSKRDSEDGMGSSSK